LQSEGAIQRLLRREHRQNIISTGIEELAVESLDHLAGTVEAEVAEGFGQGRVESGRQRAANRDAIYPLIHRDIHRIHHVELAALHRNVEQPEIPGLMTAEPMAHDVDEVGAFAEDDDVRHVVPGSPIVVVLVA